MRPIQRLFGGLSRGELAEYREKGFVVLPGRIPAGEIERLRGRAMELVRNWQPRERESVFSTVEQQRLSDKHFFASSETVSFFLEDGAQDASGALLRDKSECVNKIAHAMHDLDPVFRGVSYRAEYREMLGQLGYVQPVIVQSMYIMKPPKLGGKVVPHQDCTYVISEPSSCVGIWLAVENATRGNACLFAIPGSHKHGTLKHWERVGEKMHFSNDLQYSMDGGVCLEAEKGTVVLLHGDLVHWSEQNQSDVSRHAYTLHVVESHNCTWSARNWLQRRSLPFQVWPAS